MAELECPCGIARFDCEYHRPQPAAVSPYVGDYVGTRQVDGEWLYISAVDYMNRLVKIATFGGSGPWLNETQARALYNYTWGKKTEIPGFRWIG
jgi:hypothetical protein